jgi:MHS family citrate/tricarballylate:H+ symporter-like MFS transporter
LMGASVVGLALTPSYASIGWYAPMLAVLFRLMQGFALGGEVGPTTAYLLESAPLARRGLYVSLQNATQYFATLCAGAVGLVLANLLSPENLVAWGWRLAMLVGASVVPFALAIRRQLPETLHETRSNPSRRRGPMGGLMLIAVLGIGMLASGTIGTYTMNYVTTFATHTLGFPPAWGFAAIIVGGAAAMLGALAGGMLSDRIGRKPVMIGGNVAQLLLVLPCFWLMVKWHSLAALLLGTGVVAVFIGLSVAAIMASLTESLPISLRAGSLGILYALAIAAFGGSAQFIVTWLIAVTGSPLAPAWYMSGAMLVGLAGMIGMRKARQSGNNDQERLMALSCQRRSNSHSSSDKAVKIAIPRTANSERAAKVVAISSLLLDSVIRQARPVAVPDPAANSAVTSPINAITPPVFTPLKM